MNTTTTRWIIGIASLVLWCMGKKWGLPDEVITLASVTLPGIIGHALGESSVPKP